MVMSNTDANQEAAVVAVEDVVDVHEGEGSTAMVAAVVPGEGDS
jgi:hypothetical protein